MASDPEKISTICRSSLDRSQEESQLGGFQSAFSVDGGRGNINASESDMHAQADPDDSRVSRHEWI